MIFHRHSSVRATGFNLAIALLTGIAGVLSLGDFASFAGEFPSAISREFSREFPGDIQSRQNRAIVSAKSRKNSPDSVKLPFVGKRYFNFLGGTGTGYSIEIEPDGTTTVQFHGTASSAIEYRGRFSNPLLLSNDRALRIEGNSIYQVAADGTISPSCFTDDIHCAAELYDSTDPDGDGRAALPADDGFAEDDDRFLQQPFSRSLFQQIRQINRACGFYDVTSPCSMRIYAFKDLSLLTRRNGTESMEYTATIYRPVALQTALNYIRIFSDGEQLVPNPGAHRPDRLVYRGCPYDAGAREMAALCSAELFLTPDRRISSIHFIYSTP